METGGGGHKRRHGRPGPRASGRFRRAVAEKLGLAAGFGALRLVGLLVLAGLLGWLAWQVIVNISPRHLAGADDTSAISRADARSLALMRRVERQIVESEAVDWAEVRLTARDILRAHPLDNRTLYLLGLAAEAEKLGDQATALMELAASRSLRDRRAHFWLFGHRLQQRDFGPALDHADAILRTRRQLGPALLPAMMAVARDPEGRSRLVEMLEKHPPWRTRFLDQFSKHAADPSDPTPLYSALQAGPHPPSSAELRAHLDRLIGGGQFEQALVVWLTSLAPSEAQSLDYLYNGDFERPMSNLHFDWIITRIRGADIDVSDSPIDDGKALRVQFARARVPFRHVRKLVMLPPGAYQLSGKARTVDLRNDRGLVWKLTCADGAKEMLASTTSVTGTMTVEIEQPFSVPSQGCRAQWLRLELDARIASEQDVGGGTVWFDSLRIRRNGSS